jgi:effector-binding domain-containing protein
MISEPRVVERPAQPYVARRTQVMMQELGPVIPQLLATVYAWLREQGIAPAGAPFIRYRVIDMQAQLDIELGVPTAQAVGSEDPFVADVLPAGRYATLIYTDVARGMEANKALLDWGAQQGLVWDSWPEGNGEGFGARLEVYLTDPKDEPDLAKWETDVAIRLADSPAQL